MGLSNWWIARSEAADKNPKVAPSSSSTSSSSMFKWSLKRGKSEPRKPHQSAFKLSALQTKSSASAEPQDQTEPSTSSVPSSSSILTLKLRGLTAGVSQAKDLLQQYAAGVTLYPSLIHLTVPCGVSSKDSCSSPLDEPEPEPVLPSSSSSPGVDVTSDAQREFERQLDALVAKGLLDTRLTSDGCGGAYFLHNASAPEATPLGIFKPRDEEYMAPHNPRGYVKDNALVGETEHPVNKGFRIGDGALKERAAYLLDEAYGHFSGVPVTSVVHLPVNGVVKQGSVQQFVESECSAEDMGPLKFSVPDVHKVGILDVRLFNTDRHAGNILLHKTNSSASTYEMTPIDHGFVLPSFKHLDNAQFDWLQWPQAQFPFTSDEMDHIASLDADKDAEILKAVGIEDEAIATMKICTALLKAGADDGFSLYEIGSVLQRDGDFSQPSMLEKIVADAIRTVGDVADVDAVVDHAIRGVVALLATMQPKKKVRSISCLN